MLIFDNPTMTAVSEIAGWARFFEMTEIDFLRADKKPWIDEAVEFISLSFRHSEKWRS